MQKPSNIEMKTPLKIILLFADYTNNMSYYDDWKDALINTKELFDVIALNICDMNSYSTLKNRIKEVDCIIALHSTNANGIDYLIHYKKLIENRKCKFFTFVGNEVNYPQKKIGLHIKINFLKDVQPDFIASQLLLETAKVLYQDIKHSQIISIPHALNHHFFFPIKTQSEREIDIGTRAYKYYSLIGDNEREKITNYFREITNHDNSLKVDISTEPNQRFSREQWAQFLSSCKATIATEAGTYYLEKDDATVQKIAKHIKQKNNIKGQNNTLKYFKEAYTAIRDKVPYDKRQIIKKTIASLTNKQPDINTQTSLSNENTLYNAVDFSTIEPFFTNYPNPLNGKCISSRHFDAIGTKTCHIMFPGRFNDILKADEHYIPLNRDFSNIKEVMEKFKDEQYRTQMVNHTYQYIMDTHTYKHRMQQIFQLLLNAK